MSPPAGKIWRSAHPLQRRRKTQSSNPLSPPGICRSFSRRPATTRHMLEYIVDCQWLSPRFLCIDRFHFIVFIMVSLIDINRSIEDRAARGKPTKLVIQWFVAWRENCFCFERCNRSELLSFFLWLEGLKEQKAFGKHDEMLQFY